VATAPMFRRAYAKRRCILPIDNFFEWKAIKGARAKQPFAIGMKSGEPFGIAGIWEGWRHPESGELLRTFCIITTSANELLANIHDRMPVILPPEAHDRWLANIEPDPRDLLVPFPADPMMMWPVGTRVNKPDNDDPGILEPFESIAGSTPNLL
jgi:putative SOS response-associated peptidase YedK